MLLKKLRKEFYRNIENTDYTLCVRGGGNFSARLYETLALGRIPIFINTDCTLPFNNEIDWKKHLVWVEYDEINDIETTIHQFHHSLTVQSFQQLEKENGFSEASIHSKFFRKGKVEQWKNILSSSQIKLIEKELYRPMSVLGYL